MSSSFVMSFTGSTNTGPEVRVDLKFTNFRPDTIYFEHPMLSSNLMHYNSVTQNTKKLSFNIIIIISYIIFHHSSCFKGWCTKINTIRIHALLSPGTNI